VAPIWLQDTSIGRADEFTFLSLEDITPISCAPEKL
jgi:hypothetical protein